MAPAAKRIKSLLDALDAGGDIREDARKLAAELPGLMPDDPAMAAALEEAMAEAFAEGAGEEAALNKTDAQGNEHGEDDGRFVEKDGGSGGGAAKADDKTDKPEDKKDEAKADGGKMVQGGREAFLPHNDGRIDFKGNKAAWKRADDQAKELGYGGIDALMRESTKVPQGKIDAIMAGGNGPCEAHEAVAALRTCASIPSGAEGEAPVKLGERPLRHCICGEGRSRGPEVGRLRDLPKAIYAVRHPDGFHHELYQERVTKFPGEPLPSKTQTVYEWKNGKTFAYTDSGLLTGWENF
jgi:hypothetical protein